MSSNQTAAALRAQISEADIRLKNRVYDGASDPVWRLAVYEPVHQGWEFTNMGGRDILDYIGARARLHAESNVVEFCAGLGDTGRYLTTNFNCHVTGIDINEQQVHHARAKINEHYPHLAHRLDFIHADVLQWRSPTQFDVAFAMDSLMLIREAGEVLKKMRDATKREGFTILAEMMAGPGLTGEIRQFVWDLDGIITLPTVNEYEAMMRAARFSHIEMEDVTELAEECFDKIYRAAQRRAGMIAEAEGAKVQETWFQVADFYRKHFHARTFLYTRVTAQP